MKLAMVASGGQDFDLADIINQGEMKENDGSIGGPKAEEDNSSNNENDMLCNGHEKRDAEDKKQVVFIAGDVDVGSNVEQENGSHEDVATSSFLNQPEDQAYHQHHRKRDPVTEVCPDLQVKIADLGNACWVVRLFLEA